MCALRYYLYYCFYYCYRHHSLSLPLAFLILFVRSFHWRELWSSPKTFSAKLESVQLGFFFLFCSHSFPFPPYSSLDLWGLQLTSNGLQTNVVRPYAHFHLMQEATETATPSDNDNYPTAAGTVSSSLKRRAMLRYFLRCSIFAALVLAPVLTKHEGTAACSCCSSPVSAFFPRVPAALTATVSFPEVLLSDSPSTVILFLLYFPLLLWLLFR